MRLPAGSRVYLCERLELKSPGPHQIEDLGSITWVDYTQPADKTSQSPLIIVSEPLLP